MSGGGVDLERLINESKARLGRHKEYLERTAQRGGGGGGASAAAADSLSNTSAPPSAADAPNVSPPRTYSPSRFNTTASPQQQQQQQQQQQFHQQQQQPPRASATGRSFGSGVVGAGAGADYDNFSPHNERNSAFNPYSSGVARAGYNNYGDPAMGEDYYSQAGSQSRRRGPRRGFYLSGRTPTKVYDRGQKFVEGRESFLEQQRKDSWEKEMKECTFSPFVSKRAARTEGRAQKMASASSSSPDRSTARHLQNNNSPTSNNNNRSGEQQKREDHQQTGVVAVDHKDFLDWCVQSDRQKVGFHVDAPSVFLHIQRQQDARRAKADGEAKLTIDTSHWAPKMTIPQEFQFGRTDQPIKSLRKPMLQMVRLDSAGGTGTRSGPGTPRAGGAAQSSQSRSPRRGAGDEHFSQQQVDAQAARVAELNRTARAQEGQIREQSDEIAKLNGMLQQLRMESEAAKAKVREMAVAQTQQGGP